MLKRKIKLQVEAKKNELDMNLSNNYKDLAHDALKELDVMVEALKNNGEIKEKDYAKLRDMTDGYKRRMANYHH